MDHMLRATARAEAEHFWFRGFRRFVTPLLRRATADIPHPMILDCGCGTGANLDLLGQFGRSYGFDLTPLGLQIGKEHGRRRLVRGSVGAVPFPSNAFDLVTSFDVLYALPADIERAAASEMFRVTRPGGFVVINVAAMQALRGDHSVLVHEVRRYSRRTLSSLLTGAGFSIERLTYTNATLFLPIFLSRTVQRWRGLKQEADAGGDMTIPNRPVNALLSMALGAESLWAQSFDLPFGSSLLCLARKPV